MNAIFDTFKPRAEAVSAEVHRFARKTEAISFIMHYLREAGVADAAPGYALWADCPFLAGVNKQQLEQQVPGLSFDVTREKAAAAKIGISQLDWAMANTGPLVQDAAPVDRRLVSTLPGIHVAVIGTGPTRARSAVGVCANPAGADQLHLFHHRAQPHRRYRTRADHRCAWTGEAHHCVCRRAGGGELMRKEFRESISKALHNPNLTGALGRFSEAYRISRAKAYEGIDFEAVRGQIAERKGYAAGHLGLSWPSSSHKTLRRAAARVFRTDDPAKVREYILELAQQNGVQECRQIEVHGLGRDPPESSISRRPASRCAKPTWANGSFSSPARRRRTW